MKITFSCSCNLGPKFILDHGNIDITNLMTLINLLNVDWHFCFTFTFINKYITNNSATVIHGSATRGRHPSIRSRMTPRRRLLLQNCTTFIHLRLFSFYFTFGFSLPPSLPPSRCCCGFLYWKKNQFKPSHTSFKLQSGIWTWYVAGWTGFFYISLVIMPYREKRSRFISVI